MSFVSPPNEVLGQEYGLHRNMSPADALSQISSILQLASSVVTADDALDTAGSREGLSWILYTCANDLKKLATDLPVSVQKRHVPIEAAE